MPTWSELRELVEHGNGLEGPPVRATLQLHGAPGCLSLTVQADEPTEVLRLPAGDYRFLWSDGRLSVTGADGTPVLLRDGRRTLVRDGDGAVVDATGGRVDLHCVGVLAHRTTSLRPRASRYGQRRQPGGEGVLGGHRPRRGVRRGRGDRCGGVALDDAA
ncbi:hypothetical protein [Corynebacterium kalidii]